MIELELLRVAKPTSGEASNFLAREVVLDDSILDIVYHIHSVIIYNDITVSPIFRRSKHCICLFCLKISGTNVQLILHAPIENTLVDINGGEATPSVKLQVNGTMLRTISVEDVHYVISPVCNVHLVSIWVVGEVCHRSLNGDTGTWLR